MEGVPDNSHHVRGRSISTHLGALNSSLRLDGANAQPESALTPATLPVTPHPSEVPHDVLQVEDTDPQSVHTHSSLLHSSLVGLGLA